MEDAPREKHWVRRFGILIGGGLVSAAVAAVVRKARCHRHARFEKLARRVPRGFHLPTLVRH